MFSSLSSYVSPKAWLASYIANNLAEWLQVDPETVETSLLSQHSKICLRQVKIRDGRGVIDLVELRWTWASSNITDVTLHISGVRLVVRKDQLLQVSQPGEAIATPTPSPPGGESWAATYFQQIVDHLTVQIDNVRVSLEIENDLSVEVTVESSHLHTLASVESKLDQSLGVSNLKATVRKQAVESPLLEPWSGVARVQRVSGRRFVDGVITGLLIAGLEDSCADLLLHAGPTQLQALLSLQEWMNEVGCNSTNDQATGGAKHETMEDATQLKLPFKSVGVVLENGSTISFRNCELRYHFDASVCFFICSGGLGLDEAKLIESDHPMLVDMTTQKVGLLKDQKASEEAGQPKPAARVETSAAQLKTIINGLKGSLRILESNVASNTSADSGQLWCFDAEETVAFHWKSNRIPLRGKVSVIRARVGTKGLDLSWHRASLLLPNFCLDVSDGQLLPSGLKFGGEVSVQIKDSFPKIADALVAEFKDIESIVHSNESPGTAEGPTTPTSLPMSVSFPSLRIILSGHQQGEAKLEKVQINEDASILCAALSCRGFYKDSVVQASNIQATLSGSRRCSVKLDLSELFLPEAVQLLKPVSGFGFRFEDDSFSVKLLDELIVAYINPGHSHEPDSLDARIPYPVRLELARLVVKNRVAGNSFDWKQLSIDSMSVDVEPPVSDDDGLCMSLQYDTVQIENRSNLMISLLGKTQASLMSTPTMKASIAETMRCRITTPSDSSVDVQVVCPQVKQVVGKSMTTTDGLPFLCQWKELSIAYKNPEGSFNAILGACGATQDGQELTLSDASLTVSSIEAVCSFQSACEEIAALASGSSTEQNRVPGIPFRFRVGSCNADLGGLGQIKMTNLQAEGASARVQDIEARGFCASSFVRAQSVAVVARPSESGTEFSTTLSVMEGSACDICRLASTVEVSATYQTSGAVADVSAPLLALDVLQDIEEQKQTSETKNTPFELPFDCGLFIGALQLRYTPPQGQSDSDLWHSMELKESRARLAAAAARRVHFGFDCTSFCFQRNGASPISVAVDQIGMEAGASPFSTRTASVLWFPNIGEIESFNLKLGTIHKLYVGGSGSLTAPIENLEALLQGGRLVTTAPSVEWNLEASEPGAPPGKLPFVPPIPIQLFLGKSAVFSTLSTGKVVRLAACGALVGLAEPLPDQQLIKTELSKVKDFVYLDIVTVPFLTVSAIVHPERLDLFSKAEIGLETAVISADFRSADWADALEEGSRIYHFPDIHVSSLKIELNLESSAVSIDDAVVKFGAFTGNAHTNSASLSAHYTKQVKKRIPYFLAKTNVLGTNVGDSASSLAASVALRSTVGGSVVGVVGRDAVGSAISLGKSSRGAEECDRYRFGDFSRGLAASVGQASRLGASQRGDSGDNQYVVGDFTAGTASAAASYAAENRVRLSSATGSGLGMAAGMALAGPVGLVAGAVVGGRAAASAMTGLTGDPKKRASLSQQQTEPPDLLGAPIPEQSRSSASIHAQSGHPQGHSLVPVNTPPPLSDDDFFASFGSGSGPSQTERPSSLTQPPSQQHCVAPPAPQVQNLEMANMTGGSSFVHPHQQQHLAPAPSNIAQRSTAATNQYEYGGAQSRPPHSQSAPPPSAIQAGQGYRFGDLTRSVIARGKEKRGQDGSSSYKFGDFSRGLFG